MFYASGVGREGVRHRHLAATVVITDVTVRAIIGATAGKLLLLGAAIPYASTTAIIPLIVINAVVRATTRKDFLYYEGGAKEWGKRRLVGVSRRVDRPRKGACKGRFLVGELYA